MITLHKFSEKYKENNILSDVNINFEDNRITFIMGPNGSGKTTLIKCISGLEKYDGTILYNEKPMDYMYHKCLVIWDDCPFYLQLSGISNLIVYSENRMKKDKIMDIAKKYLDINVLKRKVKSYSYGQKKRLALILVEILNPEIIIMDEISNGLDYDTMQELKEDLQRLALTKTIILTGHQFGFYNDIIDDLIVIKDRKLVIEKRNFKNSGEKLEEIYDKKLHN